MHGDVGNFNDHGFKLFYLHGFIQVKQYCILVQWNCTCCNRHFLKMSMTPVIENTLLQICFYYQQCMLFLYLGSWFAALQNAWTDYQWKAIVFLFNTLYPTEHSSFRIFTVDIDESAFISKILSAIWYLKYVFSCLISMKCIGYCIGV